LGAIHHKTQIMVNCFQSCLIFGCHGNADRSGEVDIDIFNALNSKPRI